MWCIISLIVVTAYTKSASVVDSILSPSSWIIIILTHVTEELRMLCLWLSILGGLDVRFTQEPSDPSYFNNGSDANLVWDYTDPHNKIQYIIYSVLVNGTFVRMIFNDSRGVQEHPSIPPSYKGRVKIEGRAIKLVPSLSRTSTLETIPNLDVEWWEASLWALEHCGRYVLQIYM